MPLTDGVYERVSVVLVKRVAEAYLELILVFVHGEHSKRSLDVREGADYGIRTFKLLKCLDSIAVKPIIQFEPVEQADVGKGHS